MNCIEKELTTKPGVKKIITSTHSNRQANHEVRIVLKENKMVNDERHKTTGETNTVNDSLSKRRKKIR